MAMLSSMFNLYKIGLESELNTKSYYGLWANIKLRINCRACEPISNKASEPIELIEVFQYFF